jgi:hypothetical protein
MLDWCSDARAKPSFALAHALSIAHAIGAAGHPCPTREGLHLCRPSLAVAQDCRTPGCAGAAASLVPRRLSEPAGADAAGQPGAAHSRLRLTLRASAAKPDILARHYLFRPGGAGRGAPRTRGGAPDTSNIKDFGG